MKITTNNWKLNNKLATGQNLTWDEYSKLSSMDKFTWQQNSMINKLNNGLNSKINDIDDKEYQNDIRNKSKSEKDSMVQSFTTSDGTKLAEKINDIQKSATSEDEKAKAKNYIKNNQKAYTNAKSELAKVEIYKIYAFGAYGDWDDTDGDKLKTYLSGFKDGAKETKAWISDDGDNLCIQGRPEDAIEIMEQIYSTLNSSDFQEWREGDLDTSTWLSDLKREISKTSAKIQKHKNTIDKYETKQKLVN